MQGQRGLPLPPKKKGGNGGGGAPPVGVPPANSNLHPQATPMQSKLLFPIAPAGAMSQVVAGGGRSQQQNSIPLASPGVTGLPFAPAAALNHHHPLASFLNQGVFHAGPAATAAVLNARQAPTSNGTNTTTSHPQQRHPCGSPNFFQGWKLRSGKWLEEEEAYAEVLIEMFEKGLLADCMTGATLRAYLAQKLHCAPMRISKKYAGKCIGKKVYSCRMEMRKNVSPAYAEQRRQLQQKVEDAQKAFHESASADAVSTVKSVY